MSSSFVRLKARNWGLVEASVLTEARQLDRRNIFPFRKAVHELLIHGITANPRDSRLGRATLYHLALERLVRFCSKDWRRSTAREMREVFRLAPELRQLYSLTTTKDDWTLRFKSLGGRWSEADWAKSDWHIVFDVGGEPQRFSFFGRELQTVIALFSHLNGDKRIDDVFAAFPSRRRIARRFLRRCEELDLLERSTEPFVRRRRGSFVELIGHACLRIQERDTSIVVDPLFFIPPPAAQEPGSFSLMTETASCFPTLRAAFFTHHHWDHLHFSTIARLPRDLPIYVPHVKSPTPFNPSIVDFFRSLGFTNVTEVREWQTIELDGMRVTPTPYVGEWNGPGSAFDGFTYVVETPRKRLYGTVDSDRDERGDMLPVLKEVKEKVGRLDYVFFNASDVSHEVPAFCGKPFLYSSEFERRFGRYMRFLPDAETVEGWMSVLRPRAAVRYADFRFTRRPRRSTRRLGTVNEKHLEPGERLPL